MAKLEGVKVMDMVNGEITKISYNGAEYAKVFRKISDGKPTIEARVDDLEERVEALEKTEETTKFKVGDYIVGKNSTPYRITNEDMTLGIVEKTPALPGYDIRVKVLAHKTYPSEIGETFSVESKYFRKATAEEIEEYERGQKTKVRKFAKIGRKAGEFKKGDIVRVLGEDSGHKIKGQLGEVVEDCEDGYPLVRAVYGEDLMNLFTVVDIVAPVESVLTQK